MPEIKIKHVASFSSEDKNNPADNLLKAEGTHKWKCATAGEKQASIVLQFEKASQVHSIDIGNEGSAFVEILVGRSTSSSDDYQVLLVASTFMSPLESRGGTSRTSVRMFGADKFSKTTVGEKWDRVKIVCTQPFNKTSTFGLSFIKFHAPPDASDKAEPVKKLGQFTFKEKEADDISTGSLFKNRNKTPPKVEPPKPVTGAAAVRAASRLAEESKAATSIATHTDEKKPTSSQHTADSKKTESVSSDVREKRKHRSSSDEEEVKAKPSLKKKSTTVHVPSSSKQHSQDVPPMKKSKSMPAKAAPAFRQLMKKVVFVMSGFQNPYRAELRDKAVEMGATYKPDWGKGCTHLICAFANTPKYRQVEGLGKIVTKKWILECHKSRELLPWRSYRLGDAESPSENSADDSPDESWLPASKKSPPKKTESKKKETPIKKSSTKHDDEDEEYGGDTDSGEDTEEELKRAKAKIAQQSSSKGGDGDDVYDVSTDEDEAKGKKDEVAMETSEGEDSGIPDLPDFFTDKHFFFYGKMEASDHRLLTRYVTAYDGEIEEYMNDKVHYVVSASKWDNNFDDALADNNNLIFVKPRWVHICHEKEKLVPHQPYVVVPPE